MICPVPSMSCWGSHFWASMLSLLREPFLGSLMTIPCSSLDRPLMMAVIVFSGTWPKSKVDPKLNRTTPFSELSRNVSSSFYVLWIKKLPLKCELDTYWTLPPRGWNCSPSGEVRQCGLHWEQLIEADQ